jgi:uncharacterized cupin superfamily protein
VIPEAPQEETENGRVASGDGWFVLNATDVPWWARPGRGFYCEFEGKTDFPQYGINITVLGPGEPMSMYHWEADQEDFLVVAGEAVLVVEGEERPLKQWDLAHCPAGTEHTIIGAGDGPCVVVCAGARDKSTGTEWGGYTVDAAAIRHGAGVQEPTSVAAEAYARFGKSAQTRYRDFLS